MIDASDVYSLRGLAYLRKADYSLNRQEILDQAIADFSQAIKHRENNASDLISRARAYREKGNLEEALRDMQRILDVPSPQLIKAQAYWAIGDVYFERRDLLEAKRYYKEALQVSSDCCERTSEDAASASLLALLAIGHHDVMEEIPSDAQVLSAINKAIDMEKDPNSEMKSIMTVLRALWVIQDNPFDQGQVFAAVADLERVIKRNPSGLVASFCYVARSLLFWKMGEYRQALTSAAKAIELDPTSIGAYDLQGTLFMETGAYSDAIATLNKAAERMPRNQDLFKRRADMYRKMGNLAKARDDYGKAIELKPGFVPLYLDRSQIYEDKGDLDRAIDDLTQAIRLQPGYGFPYSIRARLYEGRGELEKAVSDLTQLVRLRPKDYEGYSRRSRIFEGLGQLDKAIDDLNAIAILERGRERAYYGLSRIHRGRGELAKADEADREQAGLELDARMASLKRTKMEIAIRRLDKSIEELTQEIKLRSSDASIYLRRAGQYQEKGEIDNAISDLNQSINLSMANGPSGKASVMKEAYSKRAEINKGKGQLDDAIGDLTELIKLNGSKDGFSAYSRRADLYRGKGELAKAVADLKSSIERGGGEDARLSSIFEGRGDFDKALEVWDLLNKRISSEAKVEVSLPLSSEIDRPWRVRGYSEANRIHKRMGLFAEAIKDLTKAIELEPNNAYLYSQRSDIHEQMGGIDKAINDLSQCIRLARGVPSYYYERALEYLKTNRRTLAIVDLKAAAKIDSIGKNGTKEQAEDKLKWLGFRLQTGSKWERRRHPISPN